MSQKISIQSTTVGISGCNKDCMIYRKCMVIAISTCTIDVSQKTAKPVINGVSCARYSLCMSLYLADQREPCCPRWWIKDIQIIDGFFHQFIIVGRTEYEENREKTENLKTELDGFIKSRSTSSNLTLLWKLLVITFVPSQIHHYERLIISKMVKHIYDPRIWGN